MVAVEVKKHARRNNGRGEKRTLKMKEKKVGMDKCGVNLRIGG